MITIHINGETMETKDVPLKPGVYSIAFRCPHCKMATAFHTDPDLKIFPMKYSEVWK